MVKNRRRFLPLKSIYTKLFLLFSIIGVIPLIVGSFYAYSNSREALLNATLKEQELEANSGRRNIVIFFVVCSTNLRLNAQHNAFVNYSEDPKWGNVYRNEQGKTLLQILLDIPGTIESAGFADAKGRILSLMFITGAISLNKGEVNISNRPFFRQAIALKEGEVYYGPPEFSQTSRQWVIPGATPVFSQGGKLHGVLFVQIYLESITQFIDTVAHSDDTVFVVDEKGALIAQSGRRIGETLSLPFQSNDPPSFRQAIQHMMARRDGSMRISYASPSYITYRYIPEEPNNQNRWSIGVITSEDAIYEGVSAKKYLFFILSASGILFTIAGILGWRTARPIQELTRTSVSMSQGDLTSRVTIKRGDEIGQLARAFNEMAASIQASHEELVRLSSVDGLTGLYNHREFQKRLEAEINRSSRYGSRLSLLMIDIDHFKKFNDTYGHQSGDEVLRSIGALILQQIRSSDFASRYGGEEMTIILPETGPSEAFIFSERLRENIQQLQVTVLGSETVNVTISIGVATSPEDATDREGLIDTADQALYFAKEKGRNTTILYGETLKAIFEKKPAEAQALLKEAEEWIFKDLATAVEARLPYRRGHFEAASRTALQVADAIQLSEEDRRRLWIATMLYDVGALNIPADILLKQGPLDEEEWKIVKTHPEMGVKILSNVLDVQSVLPAILHHHERYDGTGYPSGLKGEEIPLLARILAVVDSYCAMTSVTPYHRKLTREEATSELRRNAGTKFDPRIVEIFIGIISGRG